MSATRASMSHAPRRISSKRVGSNPYSLDGRPATALKPTLGSSSPFQSHASPPSSVSTTRGARSANFAGNRSANVSGGSTTWSSTEITVANGSRALRFGEERDLLAPPARPTEVLRACEILERHPHSELSSRSGSPRGSTPERGPSCRSDAAGRGTARCHRRRACRLSSRASANARRRILRSSTADRR